MLHIQSPQLSEAQWSPASWKTSSSGLTHSSSQNRQAAVMQQHVQRDHLDTVPSTLTPKLCSWVGQVWILKIQLLPTCLGWQARSALLIWAQIPQVGLFKALDSGLTLHPLKARALEIESLATSGSPVPGDLILLATVYFRVCKQLVWIHCSMLLRQALFFLAPFAHNFMPQAVFSTHTLEITDPVKTKRAKRAHPSTSSSLHLAVQPQPLLTLLDIGRKTKTRKTWLWQLLHFRQVSFQTLHAGRQTLPCFILQHSVQAQTWNDRSAVSRAGWQWPSTPNLPAGPRKAAAWAAHGFSTGWASGAGWGGGGQPLAVGAGVTALRWAREGVSKEVVHYPWEDQPHTYHTWYFLVRKRLHFFFFFLN